VVLAALVKGGVAKVYVYNVKVSFIFLRNEMFVGFCLTLVINNFGTWTCALQHHFFEFLLLLLWVAVVVVAYEVEFVKSKNIYKQNEKKIKQNKTITKTKISLDLKRNE